MFPNNVSKIGLYFILLHEQFRSKQWRNDGDQKKKKKKNEIRFSKNKIEQRLISFLTDCNPLGELKKIYCNVTWEIFSTGLSCKCHSK